MVKVIALTGGIGSGKSTVAELFQQLGAKVIDTDQLAREVVQLESAALKAIATRFGTDILLADGQLDRSALRAKIFLRNEERLWLEALLHPLIREQMLIQIKQVQSSYCLVSIPLLLETRPNFLIERILVVDTPEKLQLSRTMKRDQLNQEQALAIIARQVTRPVRLAAADDVIYNDQDLAYLSIQVKRLHQKYLQL